MIDSAANRRAARLDAVRRHFEGDNVDAVLDLLALVDLAWHDCYGEPAPPPSIVDDMLLVARGSIRRLTRAGLLAVIDSRDLRVAADERRSDGSWSPTAP